MRFLKDITVLVSPILVTLVNVTFVIGIYVGVEVERAKKASNKAKPVFVSKPEPLSEPVPLVEVSPEPLETYVVVNGEPVACRALVGDLGFVTLQLRRRSR